MIHDVDETLRRVVERDALAGASVEITFEAPTKDWAARRSSPVVDLYLYDIREDLDRRNMAHYSVHDDSGRVTERRPPPRRFALSYLVTAWTQRPEDEHRLLSAMLSCFLRFDALPQDDLQGALSDQTLALPVKIALPPPDDRSISDLWSALGGELKPSLDLIVVAPFDPTRERPVAPLITEEPHVEAALLGSERAS